MKRSIIYSIASLVLSILYFINRNWLIKPLPVIILSLLIFCHNKVNDNYNFCIAVGLVFSSFGDVLLEIDESEKVYFMMGLVSFLIAHICYIQGYRSKHLSYQNKHHILCIVAIYYIFMMTTLLPKVENDLIIPILIYGLAISVMFYLGCVRYYSVIDKSYESYSQLFSLIGSLFFVISDTILAMDRFSNTIPYAKVLIMITYYLGQTLIAISTCKIK